MTVKEFIKEKGKEYFINQTSPEVYKKYQEWSESNGSDVCSNQLLKESIQMELDLNLKPANINGKTMRVYTDIHSRTNKEPLFIEGEEWQLVDEFEEYEVSTLGRVKRIRGNKILWQSKQSAGYLRVRLKKDGISYDKLVHRLVAEAFISNPHDHPCVDHFNMDRTCNRVNNLRWCSYEQNSFYAHQMGAIFKNYELVYENGKPILKVKQG